MSRLASAIRRLGVMSSIGADPQQLFLAAVRLANRSLLDSFTKGRGNV